MGVAEWGLVLQGLTLLAVLLAAWQLLFHSRQMHRDFEALYVQRYWELMDRRSADLVLEDTVLPSDRVVIRGYLQLCEDEIDLRRTGRVTDSTWAFWREAMLAQLGEPIYAAELEHVDAARFPMLLLLREEAKSFDPLRRRYLWRKLHGL